ncbi:hypothetical protein ACHFJ0_15765 [Paracoccus sp. NGMCC 1.201697]|uniref:Uncharacterized protein n=1 Tax=Paracoccus broussonetiae subsp. drimophilus TaxID=3373869 RepID=A0ABW7LPM5_9RHOB
MLRRLVILAIAALSLAGSASAAPIDRSALLAKAVEGAKVCAQTMPDSRATSEALKGLGFKLSDANGPLKAYTAFNNKVVVALTSPSNHSEACIVAVGKLTDAEAMQLLQPWLAASAAQPIPVNGKFTHAWRGKFRGGPIELAITRNTNLYYFTGRAILARTAQNP